MSVKTCGFPDWFNQLNVHCIIIVHCIELSELDAMPLYVSFRQISLPGICPPSFFNLAKFLAYVLSRGIIVFDASTLSSEIILYCDMFFTRVFFTVKEVRPSPFLPPRLGPKVQSKNPPLVSKFSPGSYTVIQPKVLCQVSSARWTSI